MLYMKQLNLVSQTNLYRIILLNLFSLRLTTEEGQDGLESFHGFKEERKQVLRSAGEIV